ncbi:dihydrofolate reductase family protein [Muricauda oceani]|uniref:Dihydrofolate reductase n=1 Tax=Flagellimonas oceani TaxID=2698672 RepID=A0A6G7J283_9FLAO|nr:dihydrofolate reductase family protein [Allomuricauda oceani]MBW8244004.1 dihydrofolate reductase family protein [Allomuricauda oceani]QII44981.1 dihydrofolate reductase [Allomuricauda oceani]
MRQVILSMLISVDGYIEGMDNDIEWHVWNDEMQTYMMDFMETVDTFIYGRKSYELMLDYWPQKQGEFADIMNKTPKIVCSTTLREAKMNARVVNKNLVEAIENEKAKQGKDMVLFAGADLASSFMEHNLIDEYRLIVNPVVLGKGTPLFQNQKQQQLKLVGAKAFACGNVLLTYKPK